MRKFCVLAWACLALTTQVYSQDPVENLQNRILHFEKTVAFQEAIDTILLEWPLISTLPDSIQAQFHNNLGNFYGAMRKEHESLDNYTKATEKARPCSPAQIHGFIGQASIFRIQDHFYEALESLDKASACLGTDTNVRQYSQVALMTGATYRSLFDYKKADEWLKRALRSAKSAGALMQVADIAYHLGESQIEQDNPEKAITYFNLSLSTSDVYVTPWVVEYTLLAAGTAHLKLEQFNQAIKLLDSALILAHKHEIFEDTCFVRATLAYAYAHIGDNQRAIQLGLPVIECTSVEASEYSIYVRKGLSLAYENQGKFEKALLFLKQAEKFEELIRGTKKTRTLAQAQAEMEYGQRERALERENLIKIEKERQAKIESVYQRNIFIGAFVVIALLAVGLWRTNLLRRKNSELVEREKNFQENLLQNIVHEFRTPLTLIQGPLEQLTAVDMADEKRMLVQIAKRNTERLLALVNQLLDMAKIKAGQLKVELQPVNIGQLFSDSLFSFYEACETKRISLKFDSKSCSFIAETDPEMIQKILVNLISNAVKFTPDGGEIELKVLKSKAGFSFSVSDTGIGISPQSQKRIFEKFYQVDALTTRRAEGTGIGLAFVQDLLSVLQGKISLSSAENEGTVFTVDIPAKISPLTVSQEIKSPVKDQVDIHEPHSAENEGPVILLAEDNPDMQTYISSLLKEAGMSVELVQNGKIGLEKATATIPDLIISDVMMPEMDGFEFCHRLKSEEMTAHIPVVILTAKASQDSRNLGFSKGADFYIGKPFNANELLLVIKNALAQQNKLKDLILKETQQLDSPSILKTKSIFLQKIIADIVQNISTEARSMDSLASSVGLSRSQLHRKLKAETGMSATQFVNAIKMLHAKDYIKDKRMSVSEAAYAVGFSDPSYFTKVFTEQFGINPSAL